MSTFVLVPGAWLGGWVWKKLAPVLEEYGHDVVPVTLTGLGERSHLSNPHIGLNTAIEDVRNIIEYEDLHDVVLVGHSFAGIVAGGVTDQIPDRITTLLYLDANILGNTQLPQGIFTSWSEKGRKSVLEDCRDDGDGLEWPLTEEMLKGMAFDLEAQDTNWMMSKVIPHPIKMFQDTISLSPGYDSIRKAYLFCTKDGKAKDWMNEAELSGKIATMRSGHYSMVTKPRELAHILVILCQ